MENSLFFVFDVESFDLHGNGFAYGFVVIDANGDELDSGYGAVGPHDAKDCSEFVAQKVLPALWGYTTLIEPTDDKATHSKNFYAAMKEFRAGFWQKWLEWREKGALMVADCAWPVEARFLNDCLADDFTRQEAGPYPLLDLSSILFAAGVNPIGEFKRVAGELPAHNPLCDARHSARILAGCLKKRREWMLYEDMQEAAKNAPKE